MRLPAVPAGEVKKMTKRFVNFKNVDEELGKQAPISEKDDSPSGVIVTNVELLPVCIVFSFPIPSGIIVSTL
ncbi:hypothetical protein L1887_36031 [Cichorium endivia]|nr:hypothetical protein L1887_36031 [Cichorium endivia]